MRHVNWCLDLFLDERNGLPTATFSIEQVPVEPVLARLAQAKAEHPERIDYGVFELDALGLPQARERVLAGTPALIRWLREQACLSEDERVGCAHAPVHPAPTLRNSHLPAQRLTRACARARAAPSTSS